MDRTECELSKGKLKKKYERQKFHLQKWCNKTHKKKKQ